MATRYKNVLMIFDSTDWGSDVSREIDVLKSATGMDDNEVAILLMDVSKTTVNAWCRGARPSMHNYISVCNILGLDPRKYFILDIEDRE